MDAGRFRERVTIEAESRKANGQGGFTSGWSAIAKAVPAEIIALSGDEALRLGIERSTSQYRVRMRKRAGLSPQNRLLWGTLTLAVKSVLPDPREPHRLQLLVCESGFGS